ncbi:MAG: hypothetical protein KAS23_08855 [Anaerohalosphaera sp.]|nr:hypothetical protein [Anaerohalosphaera sp.]
MLEIICAIAVLGIVVSTVMVVTNNCMVAAMDTKAKVEAFKVARENMETLLSKTVIEEFVEYGYDEINPDIEWETEVKPFTEPVTSKMWIQATCSASYTDSNAERQTVELTHWVTGLSAADIKNIQEQNKLAANFGKEGEDPEDEPDKNDFDGTADWVINNMPRDFAMIFYGFLSPEEQKKLLDWFTSTQ